MRWSLLAVCLTVLSGCASTSAHITQDEDVLPEQTDYSVGDPVEWAILTAISSMNPGERGATGAVAYVVGNTYTAASGARCKTVMITQHSTEGLRVACTKGERWSFSDEVFIVDSNRD